MIWLVGNGMLSCKLDKAVGLCTIVGQDSDYCVVGWLENVGCLIMIIENE